MAKLTPPCSDCPLHRHCKAHAVACAGFRYWASKGRLPAGEDLLQLVLRPITAKGPINLAEVMRVRNETTNNG
jgi:hypothetical protein